MRYDLIIGGIALLVIGLFFTFVTFGLGIICSWPVLTIGVLLLLLGFALPSKRGPIKPIVKSCPGCGANIPEDATTCPSCGHLR